MAKKEDKVVDPEKQGRVNSIYQPEGEEAELRKLVYTRYSAMKDAPQRKDAETVWDNALKQWEAHRESKVGEDWQSNHYVPLTTAIIETALAEMVDQTPRPLILPRSADDGPKANVMKHIFDFTWETSDGDANLYDIMKGLLIYGTALAQEYYWQDKRIVQKVSVDKKGKEEISEKEVVAFDDCYTEPVRLQDLYIDEKGRSFDGPYGARDCVRRYVMNIEDFKLFFSGETWNPLDNAKYVKTGGDVNEYAFYHPPEGIDHSKEVEVLWYWSTKPKDRLIIVANDVVVKFGPNPYDHKQLPFARAVDIKRLDSFYGKGQSELLESVQDELNTLRRMILDRNHLDIDKMFLVSDTLDLNDEDLIARPHGLIPTGGDVNSARAIEYGDIPRSVELSLNALNEDAISTTGIDPRAASRPQPATATEAALLKEAALKKVRMKLRLLEREFLVRISRLRVSNIIQFYSEPTLEKIVGEKGTEEYKAQVEEAKANGTLQQAGGENFVMQPRTMRIEGKKLELDQSGQPLEVPSPGFSFFELKSDYFVPSARGGFDIRFAAGPTLPVSKPLLQTKTTEMYDRLIQLALGGVGYDPVRLGDMLLKVNDFDPEEFKKKEEVSTSAEAGFRDERMQQLIQLASQENEQMIGGADIKPTPYSSPAHTKIHIMFMNSPDFQNLPSDSPVIQIMTRHVMGELMAQANRGDIAGQGGGQGMPMNPQEQRPSFQGQGQQFNAPQMGGNTNNAMKQIMPAQIQGGADVMMQ